MTSIDLTHSPSANPPPSEMPAPIIIDTTPIGVNLDPGLDMIDDENNTTGNHHHYNFHYNHHRDHPSDEEFRRPGENGKASWEHVFEHETAPPPTPTRAATTVKVRVACPQEPPIETIAVDYVPIGVDLDPAQIGERDHDGDFQFRSSDATSWDHVFGDQATKKKTNQQTLLPRQPPTTKANAKAKVAKTSTTTTTKPTNKGKKQTGTKISSSATTATTKPTSVVKPKSTTVKITKKPSTSVAKKSSVREIQSSRLPPTSTTTTTLLAEQTRPKSKNTVTATKTNEQRTGDHKKRGNDRHDAPVEPKRRKRNKSTGTNHTTSDARHPSTTRTEALGKAIEGSTNCNDNNSNPIPEYSRPHFADQKSRKRKKNGLHGPCNPNDPRDDNQKERGKTNRKEREQRDMVDEQTDQQAIQTTAGHLKKRYLLFLLGISHDTPWIQVKEFITGRASIDDFRLSKRKAYWKLTCASPESQNKAKALTGELLGGHPIVVQTFCPGRNKRLQQLDRTGDASMQRSMGVENDFVQYQTHVGSRESGTSSDRTIFMGPLHPSATPFHIQRWFFSQGRIEDVVGVNLRVNNDGKHPEHYGHITFGSFRSYNVALFKLSGRRLGPFHCIIRKVEDLPPEESRSSQSPVRGDALSNGHVRMNETPTVKIDLENNDTEGSPGAKRHKTNRHETQLGAKDSSTREENSSEFLAQYEVDINSLKSHVESTADETLSQVVGGSTTGEDVQADKITAPWLDTTAETCKPTNCEEPRLDSFRNTANGGGVSLRADTPALADAENITTANTHVEIMKDMKSCETKPPETCEDQHGDSRTPDEMARISSPRKRNQTQTDSSLAPLNCNKPTTPADITDSFKAYMENDGEEIQSTPTTHHISEQDKPSEKVQNGNLHRDSAHHKEDDDVIVIDSDEENNSQIHIPQLGEGRDGEYTQSSTKEPSSDALFTSEVNKDEAKQGYSKLQCEFDTKPNLDSLYSRNCKANPNGEGKTDSIFMVKDTGNVGVQEAKINSFLEQVHGFHRKQNEITTTGKFKLDSPMQDSSEDDVEIIDNPNAEPAITFNSSDDEVEVVDGPSKPMATSEEPIDPTGTGGKSTRFRPLRPMKTPTSRSDSHKTRSQCTDSAQPERRYVFLTTKSKQTSHENSRREWEKKNFNANLSHEDAVREQERLLQAAAARMKSKKRVQVTHGDDYRAGALAFSEPVIDVQTRFPDHWKLNDPFSRLGLPKNSSVQLVKSHYRTLARFYHPDKSGVDDTAQKFQAIAEAYHSIISS